LNIEKLVNSSTVECDRSKKSRLGDIKSGDIGIIPSVRSSRAIADAPERTGRSHWWGKWLFRCKRKR